MENKPVKLKYRYFVSYAYSLGFGNSEILRSKKIKSLEELNEIKKLIEKENRIKDVAILNFIEF